MRDRALVLGAALVSLTSPMGLPSPMFLAAADWEGRAQREPGRKEPGTMPGLSLTLGKTSTWTGEGF